MFEKILTNFGLSDKEASIYISLLQSDPLSATDISKKTSVNRSTVYVVLDMLIKKNLVGEVKSTSPTNRYTAVSPEIFLKMAQQDYNKAGENLSLINKHIPKLRGLHKKVDDNPQIKIFDGDKGFIDAIERMLDSKEKEMRIITSAERYMETMPEYIVNYCNKRVENKVKLLAIVPDNEYGHALMNVKKAYSDCRYVKDPNNKIFSVDTAIFDDEIGYMFFVNKKPVTIFIQNQHMANMMKALFDLAMTS